ncbi:hypothetical protein CHARACLAT_020786 [Characodon lateralis]|uniref:Uncharacterized protein n=1 Tax=Characodon lateralis TaxID=208331 RepID=A0ABU7D918_9TELE|nr:hypothetical protein [Characodon lateralis]
MAGSKLVLEGRVSIQSFILGLSVVLIPLIRTWFGHLDWVFDYLTETPGKIAICVHIAAINGLLLVIFRGPVYKVSTDDVLHPVNMRLSMYGFPSSSACCWDEWKAPFSPFEPECRISKPQLQTSAVNPIRRREETTDVTERSIETSGK